MLALLCTLAGHALTAQQFPNVPLVSSGWDQPAASLSIQIAAILGPGQVSLSIRNISSIPSADVPSIRRLFEQDLKARSISLGGPDSANAIRITLSENSRQRLWVAEMVEGTETRITMVKLPLGAEAASPVASGLVLHHQPIYQSNAQIIATLELSNGLIVVEPEQIMVLDKTAQGWRRVANASFGSLRSLSRDPRAMLLHSADGHGFEVWLPGMTCDGASATSDAVSWEIHCRQADDPWAISAGPVMPALAAMKTGGGQEISLATAQFKAFYNASRDYFTGVVTPNPGPDLPAFYTAVSMPLAGAQTGLLIGGLDGRVQLAANSTLTNVQGTRDWGSDFTTVHTACGSGIQILATGSGNSGNDSLRAYELTGKQMIPSGSALAIEGVVLSLSTATDGTAVYAVVRTPEYTYEVDRVSATCN